MCTDGAPAMSGRFKGFWAQVKKVVPNVKTNQCIIHRESLACKGYPKLFEDTFKDCTDIINFIKGRQKSKRDKFGNVVGQ